MSDLQVAQTIVQQMGGTSRLKAMVNARDFLGDGNSVQFTFSGCRKANKCRVILDYTSDTYTLQLWKCKKWDFVQVFELVGMYWDMLKPVFEKETGLRLSL